MPRDTEALMSVLLGGQRRGNSTRPGFSIVEGRVHTTTGAGVYFVVDAFDEGRHRFGPAPWPRSLVEPAAGPDTHDHEGTLPVAGSRCLVVFVGTGVDNPWVIGWWPA